MRPLRFKLVGIWLWGVALLASALGAPEIPRDSLRWHYERALVLNAQDQTGRAMAALHRALDAAEDEQHRFERVIKTKLPEADRAALENLERTARDRRLAGSPTQRQARAALGMEFDRLASRHLSATDLEIWRDLPLRIAECRYFLAQIYWRSDRAADAILALTQVVDVPGLPEHFPARLLLAQSYSQLGAWERAQPHLARLIAATNVSDPAARRALERLQKSATRSSAIDHNRACADLRTVVSAVESAFLASPATYRELTLGRGLKDPLAYLELAHLAEEEEQLADARAALTEAIRSRSDFFPIAWLALGAEDEAQAEELEIAGKPAEALVAYQRAAEAFETAFKQLQQLDFQPTQDFDSERLTRIRQKMAALQKKASTT
ncbi:hypothetical protein J8C06_08075 [Chloracidobacterium validum]|uniref:Tetratricopeptide repeat protein n=1 Tax=Chloracidobacterium validum TaxID=2821543 RepID=A0ABX8B6L8_9BACT|nr:hypothetical protein [Chloracidobacterium validum]QUW02314.1 hypothetical protein J8C06_08075 [Chloracidobacterium validum]